ncbi:hypothetical protein NPIL_458321 [Nephila pilipes]|uniref:Uncharacterized protein n=1 Tax=Nephila pilipes TaxID=299642 RepID=A0A8X6UUJ8_NEPPI|nr:hypothetical protein NPIL_458321 [Nephila pilipes]
MYIRAKIFAARSFCNCRQKDRHRPLRSQGWILLITLKKRSIADGLEFVAQNAQMLLMLQYAKFRPRRCIRIGDHQRALGEASWHLNAVPFPS